MGTGLLKLLEWIYMPSYRFCFWLSWLNLKLKNGSWPPLPEGVNAPVPDFLWGPGEKSAPECDRAGLLPQPHSPLTLPMVELGWWETVNPPSLPLCTWQRQQVRPLGHSAHLSLDIPISPALSQMWNWLGGRAPKSKNIHSSIWCGKWGASKIQLQP